MIPRQSSLWLRRLRDGRTLVLGMLPFPLPEGVNDAVISCTIIPDAESIRDATADGRGKSVETILREGWKA